MRGLVLVVTVAINAGAAVPPLPAQQIPAHPDHLSFKPMAFQPPRARDHRVTLKNGMVVYIAEDRTLPLVNISLAIRTGSYLDPRGKEGVAALTGLQMRRGGTWTLTAEQLDERLDFLAAQVSTSIGDTAGSASLTALADNLDDSLTVFVEMLREPRFQQDRLDLAREQGLQEMKRRNDAPAEIEKIEWNALLYGEQHFTNRFATEASLRAITREDLLQFHRKCFHPANMIAAVSGAFDRAALLRKLEAAFASWPGPRAALSPVPSGIVPAKPGVYRIQKDVPQGRVTVGTPSVKRDNPDVYALEVMNGILGGSGFTSRITRTVRSNEGLAYSASSGLRFGVWYPGWFRVAFQSKSRTVPYALSLVMEEIRRMREQPVTEEELKVIKTSLVETFPSNFESKALTMALLASDEYTGRDPVYWKTYRERIRAVTAADVQRVGRTYLDPDKMIILVVGNQPEIDKGDSKYEASLAALAKSGVTVLPLRDPMTMKRPTG